MKLTLSAALEIIQDKITLHSNLEMNYYVDHYAASIISEDMRLIVSGMGETVELALFDLAHNIEK